MVLLEKEEKILKLIVVASENDPNKPEFPATPTYQFTSAVNC